MFEFSPVHENSLDAFLGVPSKDNIRFCDIYYLKLLEKSRLDPLTIKNNFLSKLSRRGVPITVIRSLELRFRRLFNISEILTRHQVFSACTEILKQHPNESEILTILPLILIMRGFYSDALDMLYLECEKKSSDQERLTALGRISLLESLAGNHMLSFISARKALANGYDLGGSTLKSFIFGACLYGHAVKIGEIDTGPFIHGIKLSDNVESVLDGYVNFRFTYAESSEKTVIMFSCDVDYFSEYGKYLIYSFRELYKVIALHVHIVNPDNKTLDWLDRFYEQSKCEFIVSYEKTDELGIIPNKPYLASSRFFVLSKFLKDSERKYIVLDADMLLNDPKALCESVLKVKTESVGLLVNSYSPIWDKISAPISYYPNSAGSKKVSIDMSNLLFWVFCRLRSKGWWYIDQFVLFACYLRHHESVFLIPNRHLVDVQCHDSAVFWALSNDKSFPKYQARILELSQQA